MDNFVARLADLTSLELEETDRFNEIPGFTGEHGGFSYDLLGQDPDVNEDWWYRLDVTCTTDLPLRALASAARGFERRFIKAKSPSSEGVIDFSSELVDALAEVGIHGCKPVAGG
ncbi:hypothetical protein LJR175_004249 [Variovorax sp. LjRoot175]|uniref:hypothetical protein n=1 Tax=Variovorax sp. LjRoot175 TaxID=3342276 RepID=UPI003ECF8EF0